MTGSRDLHRRLEERIAGLEGGAGGVGAGIFGNVEVLATFATETLNETIDKALDDPDFLAALKSTPQIPNGKNSIKSRLEQLELLRQKDLITEEEYKSKRKAIIEGL